MADNSGMGGKIENVDFSELFSDDLSTVSTDMMSGEERAGRRRRWGGVEGGGGRTGRTGEGVGDGGEKEEKEGKEFIAIHGRHVTLS